MTPTCPPGYDCTFTKVGPPPHVYAHWWDGPWGIIVAAIAIVGVVIVLCFLIDAIKDARGARRQALGYREEKAMQAAEQREQRQHALAIEEQRTMQLDTAKGDPEMLRIVREMQRM